MLDGTNYYYWRACMVAFLKYMGNKTWNAVIRGWTPQVITTKDDTQSLKPEKDGSKVEDEESHGNS